ncbi:hypothetical protein [Roseixanthobacter pseudopolyaromaticivorans]|uniref:hypothetical protein n=1 Tax=Xanthobacteraceae TaxID=335928 RepID=UPI003727E50B
MFQLVTIAGGAPVPVLAADGKPFVFETGREAAEVARMLTVERGHKVQPRPMLSDGSWKEREASRFADGTYQAVPWADAPWFAAEPSPAKDHFVHVSKDVPGMVAYTEDAAKGAADRQTRVKAGVYLHRYFGEVLSSDEIRDIATEFTAEREDNTLLFAATADDIERVYTTGPESCMAHPSSSYESSIHPVRVYAAGDLQVAYIERGGDITARALVWPKKKAVGRIYGDEARLLRLLRLAGYGYPDTELFDGARLLRIEERGTFVAPYLDGDLEVNDGGKFLVITSGSGDVCCGRTDGFADEPEEEGQYCNRCEEHQDEDGFQEVRYHTWNGRTTTTEWCEHCCDNSTFVCDSTGERWCEDDAVLMENGETWSKEAFEDGGFICDATSGNYPNDERVELSDGTVWCKGHFDEHGFTCPDCGENFAQDDGEEIDGVWYCTDCAEKHRSTDDASPEAPPAASEPTGLSGWDALQALLDERTKT